MLVPVGFSVVVFEFDEVLGVVVLDAVVCSTGGLYSDKYEPATNACVPSACSMTNHNVSFPLYSVTSPITCTSCPFDNEPMAI